MNILKKLYKECPNGHIIWNSGDRYCYQCGEKLILTTDNPYKQPICPKCKKTVDRADVYCPQCGEKIII